MKEFVDTILFEGGVTCIEGINELLVVVSTDDLNSVRGHHKGGRKTDVTQSNYINHEFDF